MCLDLCVYDLTTGWFDVFGNPLSAKQNWERVPAVVGLVMLTDLNRIIHKIVMQRYRPFLFVQRVQVVQKRKEAQHLEIHTRPHRNDE